MVLRIPKVSLSTIIVLFPILYYNSCTFEFIKPYSFTLPLVGVFLLTWLVLLAREGATINVRNLLPMVVYAFLLLVLVLMGATKRVEILSSDMNNALYMLIFMCVLGIYSGEQYKNDRTFIVSVWLADTVITCVYSIYRLINEPNLSRLLSTGSYHATEEAVAARGIASFGVIYGLVLIVLAIFYLVLQSKKKRFVNICLFTLFLVLLFLAQFLIAIGLVAIGMIWMLFINNPTNSKNKRIHSICFIILGVVFIFCLPFLLRFLADNDVFGYEIDARLEEIMVLFNGGDLEGTDISARFTQYTMSLKAFFTSYGMGKIAMPAVEVGYHSGWLDGLGNYGILFLLHIAALFAFRSFVLERLPNQKSKQLYRMLFVIYIIMSLTNTSTWAPITLSLCVIVPFVCMDKVSE